MVRNVVLAVLVSILATTMFAERLGVSAGLAVYVTGMVSTARGGVLTAAMLLALVMAACPGDACGLISASSASLANNVAGFWLGLALLPHHQRDAASGAMQCPSLRRDEAVLIAIALAALALLALIMLFPVGLAGFSSQIGFDFVARPEIAVTLAGLIALAGGGSAVLRSTRMLTLLAGLFIVPPALFALFWQDGSAGMIPAGLDVFPVALGGLISDPASLVRPASLGMGFALAMIAQPVLAAFETRSKRILVAVLAPLLLAIGLGIILGLGGVLDRTVAREMIGAPLANWPVFTFDEALRGWIRVCGSVAQDALDVVEACRARGVTIPLTADAFTVDPALRPTAIAASLNLPIMLGVIWVHLAEIGLLLVMALLLISAGGGLSELALTLPPGKRRLKSTRLFAARLMIVILCFALAFAHRQGLLVDPQLLACLGLGFLFLVGLVVLGAWVRRFAGWLSTRRMRRATISDPDPAPAAEAGAP